MHSEWISSKIIDQMFINYIYIYDIIRLQFIIKISVVNFNDDNLFISFLSFIRLLKHIINCKIFLNQSHNIAAK